MMLNWKLLRNVAVLCVACLALSTTGCKKKSSKKGGKKSEEVKNNKKNNQNQKQSQVKYGQQVTEGDKIVYRGTDKVFEISGPKVIRIGEAVSFQGRCDKDNKIQLTWTFPPSGTAQYGSQYQGQNNQSYGQTVTRQGNQVSYTFSQSGPVKVQAACAGGSGQRGELSFTVQPRTGTYDPNNPNQSGTNQNPGSKYGGNQYGGCSGSSSYSQSGCGGSCSGSSY